MAARACSSSPFGDTSWPIFVTASSPALTARSASSSCACGYPKKARISSGATVAIVPPIPVIASAAASWKFWVISTRSSGSKLTANPIAPTSLQDSAVTCRRSGSLGLRPDCPTSAHCGCARSLYPIPGTVTRNRGTFGSGSILRRSRATSMSTLRSKGSASRPATARRNLSRDTTWQGLAASSFRKFVSARVSVTSRPAASTKTQPAKSSLQSSMDSVPGAD